MLTDVLLGLFVLFQPIFALPHNVPRQRFGDYKRLITFGDSYSDDGHGAWVVTNRTWPSDPAYFGHHFSNGPVWPQNLAGTLGVELLDYACGGATADNNFVQGYTGYNSTTPVPSVNDQITAFLSNSTVSPTSDIFIIYIGANDILFNTTISGASIARIIEGQVHRLYAAGATTILLASYPVITTLPAEAKVTGATASNFTAFGANLTAGLHNITTAWRSYIRIAVADIGGLFAQVQADPEGYGINASYVNPPTACLIGAYPGEGPRMLCSDPARHLWFDTYHPTDRMHIRMAAVFAETLQGFFTGDEK